MVSNDELMTAITQLRKMNIFGCGVDIETMKNHSKVLEEVQQTLAELKQPYYVVNLDGGYVAFTDCGDVTLGNLSNATKFVSEVDAKNFETYLKRHHKKVEINLQRVALSSVESIAFRS
jgi:hypothetical protein